MSHKPFLPEKVTRYDLWTSHQIEELGANAPYGLARASEQFVEWLKWPQKVEVEFLAPRPIEDRQCGAPRALQLPRRSTLFLRIEQTDQPKALYSFSLQLLTDAHNGIIDAAEYNLAQITYEEYIIPWSISVRSLSRVLFPRRRAGWPQKDPSTYSALQAPRSMRAITEKLRDIRIGPLSTISNIFIDNVGYTDKQLRTTYVES